MTTTKCPTCDAPCTTTVNTRGGEHGWSTTDAERTVYRYAAKDGAAGQEQAGAIELLKPGRCVSVGDAPYEDIDQAIAWVHGYEACRSALAAPGAAIAAREQEATELLAIADFLGGAKDRFNRPDASANDQMRSARAAIQSAALRHGVAGGHHTYLDQCAAVLRVLAGGRQ